MQQFCKKVHQIAKIGQQSHIISSVIISDLQTLRLLKMSLVVALKH